MQFIESCMLLIILHHAVSLDLRIQQYKGIKGKQIIGEVIHTSINRTPIQCATAALQQSGLAYNIMNNTGEIICEIIVDYTEADITENPQANYYRKCEKCEMYSAIAFMIL